MVAMRPADILLASVERKQQQLGRLLASEQFQVAVSKVPSDLSIDDKEALASAERLECELAALQESIAELEAKAALRERNLVASLSGPGTQHMAPATLLSVGDLIGRPLPGKDISWKGSDGLVNEALKAQFLREQSAEELLVPAYQALAGASAVDSAEVLLQRIETAGKALVAHFNSRVERCNLLRYALVFGSFEQAEQFLSGRSLPLSREELVAVAAYLEDRDLLASL